MKGDFFIKTNVKILIAAHKPCIIPKNDGVYLPVFVGAGLNKNTPDGFQPDSEGQNISLKNPYYNELTAIYWAWKNLNCDIVGLVHYRRYFVSVKTHKKNFDRILDLKQIQHLIGLNSIVVPRKRRYYIETIETHYLHTHLSVGLEVLKDVFKKQPRQYQAALTNVLSSRSAHMFNMFIMNKGDFDKYCTWLFGVLQDVENQINFKKLQGNEKRVIGFLAEFLLDVWLQANKKDVVESPVLFMENNHWPKKIMIFLMNKLLRGKLNLNTHIK